MVFGPLRLTKTLKKLVTTRCEGAAAVVPPAPALFFFSFMVVFFTGDAVGFGRWIVFAEGSTGGAAKYGLPGGGFWSLDVPPSSFGLAVAVTVTAMAGIAVVVSHRDSLRSPWSQRRRKNALQPKQWHGYLTPEGRLSDRGLKFLKNVRSGGVDPSMRAEAWPFLLGVYDLNSTKEERDSIRKQKQKEFKSLREQCLQAQKPNENDSSPKPTVHISNIEDSSELRQVLDSGDLEDVSSRRSISVEESD